MKKLIAGALLGSLSLVLLVGSASVEAARGPRLVGGIEANDRVSKLTSEIRWHTSLGEAKADAARQGKMILWVHMLGDLSGKT